MPKRNFKEYPFQNRQRPGLLAWAMSYKYFSFIHGNDYPTLHGPFPDILFVGRKSYTESSEESFAKLEKMIGQDKDWLYGYFSYDLKNEIEALESNNPVSIPVKNMGFYVPEIIIHIRPTSIVIESFDNPDTCYSEIISRKITPDSQKQSVGSVTASTSKRQYMDHVRKIKAGIVEGEFYEMNYCIEFTADTDSFDPMRCYQRLNSISPMPFSAFMRIGDVFCICASPERFLKKEGNKIISQPIKGTTRRSFDKKEDEALKDALESSEKERAENLMIVDLVRNDLAKSSQTGTVSVDELFGMYTFKKVHQMISTVTSRYNPNISITDIIKHAFPMGSMTGAPKIRVMREIESLENSSRGLYSGAIGYFSPDGNFDFNVVIRSIIYNSKSGKLSFHVGSAITYDSDPEFEYNECLLKAESMLEVLS